MCGGRADTVHCWTKSFAFAQVLFVLAAMAATFLLVPRGFSAGEIDIQADKMSWNVRLIPSCRPMLKNTKVHLLA